MKLVFTLQLHHLATLTPLHAWPCERSVSSRMTTHSPVFAVPYHHRVKPMCCSTRARTTSTSTTVRIHSIYASSSRMRFAQCEPCNLSCSTPPPPIPAHWHLTLWPVVQGVLVPESTAAMRSRGVPHAVSIVLHTRTSLAVQTRTMGE